MKFSIIINTDGRPTALKNTLDSLSMLDYPTFEICVVNGPTNDGTDEVLAEYSTGSRALAVLIAIYQHLEISALQLHPAKLLLLLTMMDLRNLTGFVN